MFVFAESTKQNCSIQEFRDERVTADNLLVIKN